MRAVANLTISPTVGWVADGNSTPLEAIWSVSAPACTLDVAWYQWFARSGPVGGVLLPLNGSATNFTGAASTTETTFVGVRSGANLTCGNSTVGEFRTAYANVTTVAPLTLDGLSVSPLLLPSFGTANLSALVEGGVPPYLAEVRWGDGALSSVPLAQSGPFETSHAYGPGAFAPQLTVTDSSGLESVATAPELVQASNSTLIGIRSSHPVDEVGLPVRFTSETNPSGADDRVGLVACGTMVFGAASSLVNITCDPPESGILPAIIDEVGGNPDDVRSVQLDEPVVAALTATVSPLRPAGEEGQPLNFGVQITGGVPPFTLAGSFEAVPLPTGPGVPGDGTICLTATPVAAGLASLSLDITDADGIEFAAATTTLVVDPTFSDSLVARSSLQGLGAQVSVTSTFTGGVGPVAWVVQPTPAPVSGDPPAGEGPSDASFDWTGTFDSEGAGLVVWTAVDAAGNVVRSQVDIALVPPLSGQLSVVATDPPSGPALNLTLDLEDGVPPFSVWVNVTDSGSWTGTDPSDGPYFAEIPLGVTGPLSVFLVAVDSLGARVLSHTSVVAVGSVVTPPPAAPPPPSSDVAPILGAGLGVALLGGGAVLYLRRRRASARLASVPVDPVKVLEGILAPADGAERVTVELLAEEAGVPLPTVRSTLTELIAAGRVRSEVSPEGEEVLAWSTPPRP